MVKVFIQQAITSGVEREANNKGGARRRRWFAL
jgi:hypothetical protein